MLQSVSLEKNPEPTPKNTLRWAPVHETVPGYESYYQVLLGEEHFSRPPENAKKRPAAKKTQRSTRNVQQRTQHTQHCKHWAQAVALESKEKLAHEQSSRQRAS